MLGSYPIGTERAFFFFYTSQRIIIARTVLRYPTSMYRYEQPPYVLNLRRIAYGFVLFAYLFLQVVLYSTTFPHLIPSALASARDGGMYGILLYWQMFKPLICVLAVHCIIQRRVYMGIGLVFAAVTSFIVLGSMAFLVLLVHDAFAVANTASARSDHPAHDPLYCCVFHAVNPGCAGFGPCLDVDVTNTSLPIGNPGDVFAEITLSDLKLEPTFRLSLIVVLLILLIEIPVWGVFMTVLSTLNRSNGFLVDVIWHQDVEVYGPTELRSTPKTAYTRAVDTSLARQKRDDEAIAMTESDVDTLGARHRETATQHAPENPRKTGAEIVFKVLERILVGLAVFFDKSRSLFLNLFVRPSKTKKQTSAVPRVQRRSVNKLDKNVVLRSMLRTDPGVNARYVPARKRAFGK